MTKFPYAKTCISNKGNKKCADGKINVRDTTGQNCQGNECWFGWKGLSGITGTGFNPTKYTIKPAVIYLPNGYGGKPIEKEYYKNLDTRTICALSKKPVSQSNFECYDSYNKCATKVDLSKRKPLYYDWQ